MTVYTKGINEVASSADGTTIFTLTSTEERKLKLRRLVYTDVADNAIVLEVWLENELIVNDIEIQPVSDAMPERFIDIDVDIPVGSTCQGVIKDRNAGSHGTLTGYIEYVKSA